MSTPDLDWTFGPAPAADDEPPPNTAPRRPRPNSRAALRLSRRTWLLLGAVAVLALGLTVALPLIQNARSRQAVEQVVAKQEAARLAGDWDALSATYAADNVGWAITRVLRLRNGWLPTPISLPGLHADGRPGRVSRFQVIGPQLARADVQRGFVLANGAHVTFAMPQFYQFTQAAGQPAAWLQAPPPETPNDQAQHIHGPRVDVTYYPDDGDLASRVATDLSDLLVRACVDWNCPPELHVAVTFNPRDPASAASPAAFDSLLGSLSLQIILGRPSTYPTTEVNLASRLAGGYPADAAASEAVRRAAGVQALILVAQQLAPNTLMHGENAYLDAMIAREASRLGIDAPGLRQMQIANPLFNPMELWSVPLLHFTTDGALPEALVILNQILADRDVTDEQRLMHALNTAADAETWLAAGLGLERGEVELRIIQALDPRFPSGQWPSFEPDLALSCPTGPVLASLDGQTAPLFDGNYPDSSIDGWSPDGRHVALRVSGRLSVVDLSNHTGLFLPMASFQEGIPPAWASNVVLVYPASTFSKDSRPPFSNVELIFYNVSELGFGILPDYVSYLAAPSRAWAVLSGEPFGAGPELALIRALGPQVSRNPIFIAADGYNPAWSADSQHLAFALHDSSLVSLVVFDLASRDKRTILTSDNTAVPNHPRASGSSLMPAWSPAGDRLAVVSVTNAGNGFGGWAGLIRPDGAGFKRLPDARANMAPEALAYSPDGLFLAVSLFDNAGAHGVAIYSADGALLRGLPGFQVAAWSPTGHILALTSLDGVSLLHEPDATPQQIGPAGCTELAWKP
jgi:hypothetical protein